MRVEKNGPAFGKRGKCRIHNGMIGIVTARHSEQDIAIDQMIRYGHYAWPW
jgi:hypothetical protein